MKNLKLLIFLFLFLIPLISSAESQITIKTIPNHNVDISFLRHNQGYSLIESFHKNSGTGGNVSVIFSTSESKFDMRVWVKKDNTEIVYEKFEEGYVPGSPLEFEVYPDWYLEQLEIENEMRTKNGESPSVNLSLNEASENEENLTLNETEKNAEKNSSASEGITGFFVSMKDGISKKTIYYAAAFVLLVALTAAGFFTVRKIRRRSPAEGIHSEIKIRKLSDKIEEGQMSNLEIIEAAEKKIREAQEQIEKIKDKMKD
ncbi:hypothetical protein HY449_02660 [Candidatus Pacearchaeota archaeon]|nr:hypothetical protein [Candidatus Pacearchaeota archaeon]